jgi:hypothetical protein
MFNPLNAELNPICHLMALLGAHPIPHGSRIRIKVRQVPDYKTKDELKTTANWLNDNRL